MNSIFDSICQEYFPKYEQNALDTTFGDLVQIAESEADKATSRYQQLSSPKFSDQETYLKQCIRTALVTDFAQKSVTPISPENPNPYFRSLSNLLTAFPFDVLDKPKVGSDSTKFDSLFCEMLTGREELAKNKGFDSYLQYSLSMNDIPESDFQEFSAKTQELIIFINSKLATLNFEKPVNFAGPQEPCFTCAIHFPQITFDDIFPLMFKLYPNIAIFQNKIKIHKSDNSNARYNSDLDLIEINIKQGLNEKHKILELIHELSHAVVFVEDFEKGIEPLAHSKYVAENKSFDVILETLKTISPDLYSAYLGNLLNNLQTILFEIEIHQNPKKSFAASYAKTLNQCFPSASQIENYAYQTNRDLILRPFVLLNYVLSYTKILAS